MDKVEMYEDGTDTVSDRVLLLEKAIEITTKDRNAAYGNPENNFFNIATYWRSYLLQRFGLYLAVTPQDVAHLMILMKMARLAANPEHYDSLLDIAGYAACARDCQVAASMATSSGPVSAEAINPAA